MADAMPPPMAPADIICISLTAGNKINGHEWNSGEQYLMYACYLPLPTPTDYQRVLRWMGPVVEKATKR